MPFSKRKSGRRGPVQRLSDQRRSLALAGLAAGAAFSAAIFRRRWHRGELEAEPAMVRDEEPGTDAQPAAPPSPAQAPPPVVEPEVEDEPRPINAPQTAEEPRPDVATTPAPSAPAPTAGAETPVREPATGELSAEEASILSVLAQSGRADDDRTALAVATSLERDTGDVVDVLRKLGAEGVVSGELRTPSGDEIWAVTERGVRRLGAQS